MISVVYRTSREGNLYIMFTTKELVIYAYGVVRVNPLLADHIIRQC